MLRARLRRLVAAALLARSRERRVVDTEFPVEDKFDHLPRRRTLGASAFLTVQEGCDKFCAFCVVPYTRGAEVSRSVAAVLAEVPSENPLGAVFHLAGVFRQIPGPGSLSDSVPGPHRVLVDAIHQRHGNLDPSVVADHPDPVASAIPIFPALASDM